MAKVNAPLLSWGASGSIAKTQTYSTWKGRPYVRQRVIPANPDTAEQQLTRNTWSFLNRLWQYMPAGALGAWGLYADNNRFTSRNGWLKLNNGPLRTAVNLLLMTISPSAGGGIPAVSAAAVAGAGQITVTVVAPTLPAGWTITKAWAMAIANVNPQTSSIYSVGSGSDATSPYAVVITGLIAAQAYITGGWFEYLKPDGSTCYGIAVQATATPT